MIKIFGLAVGILALVCSSSVKAQTTQLIQTGPDHCIVNGCVNAPLSDGELFSWSDTLRYLGRQSILGKLSFRGINYDMQGQASGYETIDLAAVQNNGFAVHADFDVDYFRGPMGWDDGYLKLPNEYVGSDPTLYGYNGQVNITTGTGQVGLVTASSVPLTVTLTSSDTTQIQVPASVVILAGTLDANFTITATAPTQSGNPPPLPLAYVTITATFPDNTTAVTTVNVQPLPAPPPPPPPSE